MEYEALSQDHNKNYWEWRRMTMMSSEVLYLLDSAPWFDAAGPVRYDTPTPSCRPSRLLVPDTAHTFDPTLLAGRYKLCSPNTPKPELF